jgi:hypothetical protein
MNAHTLSSQLTDAIPLAKAASLFPARPHAATVFRWATKGVRGVRLDSWFIGGTRHTSPAAIERFLADLNADRPTDSRDAAADQARRAAEAGKALEALGC